MRRSQRRIQDYDQTSAKNIDHLATIASKQAGDPERGAKAILEAVNADKAPLHLVLGSDALRRTREKLAALATELEAWQEVSTGTDFPAH